MEISTSGLRTTLADIALASGQKLPASIQKAHESRLQRKAAWEATGHDLIEDEAKTITLPGSGPKVPSWMLKQQSSGPRPGFDNSFAEITDTKNEVEAFLYTRSLYPDEDIENNEDAKKIYFQRIEDNRAGKNDLSDFSPFSLGLDIIV